MKNLANNLEIIISEPQNEIEVLAEILVIKTAYKDMIGGRYIIDLKEQSN